MGKLPLNRHAYLFLSVFFAFLSMTMIFSTARASKNPSILDQMFLSSDDGFSRGKYYASSYSSLKRAKKASEEVSIEAMKESVVLLRNQNDTLPLLKPCKVTLYSRSSTDLIVCGTGSSSIDLKKKPSLKSVLEKSGFEVNPVLYQRYLTDKAHRVTGIMETPSSQFDMDVGESGKEIFDSAEVRESLREYSDLGIIVISRLGGEGYDLPSGIYLNSGVGFLALTKKEKDMISMAKEYSKKTLVLLNTGNPMECSFLDEYDIDVCLSIGYVGEYGLMALPDILLGKISPSGRLSDTYLRSNRDMPSVRYSSDNTFSDRKNPGEWDCSYSYLIESENLYIGYRYFETRYFDSVVSRTSVPGGFDYDGTVMFPYGYGLSYTSFSEEICDVSYDGDVISIKAKVRNTGKRSGKHVSLLFSSSMYTDYDRENGIEKSAVSLIDFRKSKELRPKEEEEFFFRVSPESLSSYDSKVHQAYLLEKGTYYFSLAKDSHQAVRSVLKAMGLSSYDGVSAESVEIDEDRVYRKKGMKNRFSDVLLGNYFDGDFYLSRRVLSKDRSVDGSLPFLDTIENDLFGEKEIPPLSEHEIEDGSSLSFIDLKDIPLGDSRWDSLVDSLSVDELASLTMKGGFSVQGIASISSPQSFDRDGCLGLVKANTQKESATLFPSPSILSSGFSREIMEKIGKAMAEEALFLKVSGIYAPGVNIHRNPYGGRNFEYFSEDPYQCGVLASSEILGMKAKGLSPYLKHFALNEQETHRNGISVFNTEQAIREIYLRPFEIAVETASPRSIMCSLNRIGTSWCGASEGLLEGILRSEWGFSGMVSTDYTNAGKPFMSIQKGLVAGTDLFLCSNNDEYDAFLKLAKENPSLLPYARRAAKNILFSLMDSSCINSLDGGKAGYWKVMFILFDSCSILLTLVCVFLLVLKIREEKKRMS